MRNKNLKKALCLILLSFLLSTITLTSFADEPVVGEPYIEEIDTSELKLYVPGIPGVTRDIPLSEKGNTVSLGSSIKAEYLQKAAIGINSEEGFMPSEKDVLFVLDTSFLEGDSNEFLSLVEHTLFSREDATILGGGMTIDGKSFIKDNIVNHNDSIEINGNIEYSEIGPHNIKSITGEEIILSEDENDKNYKGKYDHYFPEETGFGGINYIFKKLWPMPKKMYMKSLMNHVFHLIFQEILVSFITFMVLLLTILLLMIFHIPVTTETLKT